MSMVVKKEIQKIQSTMTMQHVETEAMNKRSYSEIAKNENESVIIIRPKTDEEGRSSEVTKWDMKSKIDIAKLGVGITKMKKITRGAVVVGCENRNLADKFKEKVAKDLGEKYSVQVPILRKRK